MLVGNTLEHSLYKTQKHLLGKYKDWLSRRFGRSSKTRKAYRQFVAENADGTVYIYLTASKEMPFAFILTRAMTDDSHLELKRQIQSEQYLHMALSVLKGEPQFSIV